MAALAHADGPRFTGAQLRDDLAQLDRALHEMPPDLAHSADIPQLERAIGNLDATLATSPPLNRDAAWRLFATLNPLLADGHLFVGFLDWRGESRAHLAAGGVLFPFEMRVSPACALRVRAMLGGASTDVADAELRSVNGIPAPTVCEEMLARVHGETREFRADLVSRRFWFYYWKVFGSPVDFDIGFAGEQAARKIHGSAQLPQLLTDEADFARQFQLELAGTKATLKLGTFAWPDRKQLFAFTRASFEAIRAARVRTLVIDLRDNGGGDDESWIDGVMPYIASRPYRIGSHYRKRVVVADPARHETAGSVVEGSIDDWFAPQPRNPLRFRGNLELLLGPGTYSSAIVMANVVEDFGFGRVTGRDAHARPEQSGGARRTTLTNCGLIVVTPRFLLTRPAGGK